MSTAKKKPRLWPYQAAGGPIAPIMGAEEARMWDEAAAESGQSNIDDTLKEMAGEWEASGHTNLVTLWAALHFAGHRLPSWLASGLAETLEQQLPRVVWPYHELRWWLVSQAHDGGLSLDAAYKDASEKLRGTPARGSKGAMEKSYQKMQPTWGEGRRKRQPSRRRSK